MSRARSINHNGITHWFDTHRNSAPANIDKLELLAAVENIEIDDLLDEGLNQGAVIERLRKGLDQGVIPAEVLERQRARRAEAGQQRICRIHGENEECEGRITRHHFISKWLMKELENYNSYARRDRCTIPICMGFHRDLHMRQANGKSIVEYLNDEERAFAHKMIEELEEQHPKIIKLLRKGDPEVSYEARLIRDYDEGKFSHLTSAEKSVYFTEAAETTA
jgi:hypothetical protein